MTGLGETGAVAAGLSLGTDGTIDEAILVLGAVAPTPKIAVAASEALRFTPAGEDSFASAAIVAREEAEPITDVRGSADFRRELLEVLTRRALAKAHDRARGAEK